jgi:hypothetical protein
MHKLSWILLLISTSFQLFAQRDAGKYAGTITTSDLRTHLTVIAGPEMEGRETASPGQKKAAAYIEGQFKALALKPGNRESYLQVFSLMEDTIISTQMKIAGREYAYGKDYMMAARFNKSRQVSASTIVFAGYGISDSLYNDYAGLEVKGAIVIIVAGEPKVGDKFITTGSTRPSSWSSLPRKMEAAYQNGAAGIFLVSPRTAAIDSAAASSQRKTGVYFPSRQAEEIYNLNYASVSHQVFREILGLPLSDSLLNKIAALHAFSARDYSRISKDVQFNFSESSYEKATSSNVLALIEGTDKKDEYVFITAHYDHLGTRGGMVYHGADDDGSGTVSVLEMAEAFARAKAEGNGPRRSIVFMTVSGEEKGLWGSAYYADNPVFPLEKTTVDLNIDMVGRIDPKRKSGDSLNYVYVIGDDKVSSDLKPISEAVNKTFTQLELDYKYNDPADPERIFYRSDHYNFARKGVPILFYFNGTHADYHRPSDTIEKINFDLMQKRVRLVFHTAWEIANRNDMLKRDIPLQ